MRIAIVGYGVEGQSAYAFFRKQYPDAELVIYDESENTRSKAPEHAELHIGPITEDRPIDADTIVRSPSVSPSRITTDGRITSITKEFFARCPAPIIGVTGTKGKGTTASLIHSILTAAGKKSWLVGNIGTAALDILDGISAQDVVVYELSSFQLWDLDTSPHIAVVLMIEPDHLDVHANMLDYIEAKANIRRYQDEDDFCYYHPSNEYSRYIALETVAEELRSNAFTYGDPNSSVVFVKENTFFIQNDPICSVDSLQIYGKHNIENACAAISAVRHFVTDPTAIRKGLEAFEGLPHRLKKVREVAGVLYVDDSIATTPGSAIAAINSFDRPKIMVLGGSDKGADFSALYENVTHGNVRHVITIGTVGEKIARELTKLGYEAVTNLGMTTMQTVVEAARQKSREGDVVIMSPACASFDMFKSYADRGEQFVAAVGALPVES